MAAYWSSKAAEVRDRAQRLIANTRRTSSPPLSAWLSERLLGGDRRDSQPSWGGSPDRRLTRKCSRQAGAGREPARGPASGRPS